MARICEDAKIGANCARFSMTGMVLHCASRLRSDPLDCVSMLYLTVAVNNNKALSLVKRLAQDFSFHCPRVLYAIVQRVDVCRRKYKRLMNNCASYTTL